MLRKSYRRGNRSIYKGDFKMKLFTISDMGVSTGFARVMESIIQHFPESWEIHSLGINYKGDPHETRAKIYPAIVGGDVYGFGRVRKLLDKIKPDKIFILQDSWIICEYLKLFTPAEMAITTLYTPVDARPFLPRWLKDFSSCENVVTYTEYGKQVLLEANPDLEVKIIPHGVDKTKFFPIEQDKARNYINTYKTTNLLTPDLFIVLNANRNQPRKRIDIALAGFAIFAKDKKNVRYLHHAGIEETGWNVVELSKRFDTLDKLILTSKELSPINAVSDEVLNLVYNAADVGLNTSTGEGWGLCVHPDTPVLTEHGYIAIKNIRKGDYVYTDKGRLQRVTNVFCREYAGEMRYIRVSGSAEDFFVTPEHPLYIEKAFIPAKHVTKGMMWFKPHIISPTTIKRVDLSHYFLPIYSDLQYNYFIGKSPDAERVTKSQREILQRKLKRPLKTPVSRYPRWLNLTAETAPLFARVIGTHRDYTGIKKYSDFRKYVPHIFSAETQQKIRSLASTQFIFMTAPEDFLLSYLKTLIEERVYTLNDRKAWCMYLRSRSARYCTYILLQRLQVRFTCLRQRTRKTRLPLESSILCLDKRDLTKYFEFDGSETSRGSRCVSRQDFDGSYHKITENKPVYYEGLVCNLEVENDNTYLIGGYAVHNCNMEHAITGKPQVVPNHSALGELYVDGRGVLLGIDHYDINIGTLTTGAVTSPLAVAQALNYLYYNPEARKKIGEKAQEFFSSPEFDWKNIAKQFEELLKNDTLA